MGNWGSKKSTSQPQSRYGVSSSTVSQPVSPPYTSYSVQTSSQPYASQTATRLSSRKTAPSSSSGQLASQISSQTAPSSSSGQLASQISSQTASQPSSVRISSSSAHFTTPQVSSQTASQPSSSQIKSQTIYSSLSSTVGKNSLKPPEEIHASCCFPANSYIISVKEEKRVAIGEPAYHAIADKFALRLCPQYISRRGCSLDQDCRRIHICRAFCEGNCTRTDCDFGHSLDTPHNSKVLSCYKRRRDYSEQMVKESLLRNEKHRRPKRNAESVICIYSVMRKCKQENCNNIHASKPFLWEVQNYNGCWLKLSFEQQDALEHVFSNPNIQNFTLPALHRKMQHHTSLKELFDTLGCKVWTADLSEFVLRNGCLTLKMRRCSTPSDVTSNFGLSTRWIWYWMDENSIWHPYTSGTIGKFYTYALSDQLEHMYHYTQDVTDIEVTFDNREYKIDLEGKSQYTLWGQVQKMCRRPCAREDMKEEHFYGLWSQVPSGSKFLKTEVFRGTVEFNFVKYMLTSSLPMASISKIYRVQNEFLWKAYQVKKEELMAKYKKEFLLKEQYLFHGTRHSVIDHICEENFDW